MTANVTSYYKTEQQHQRAFEKYWSARGIKVQTYIEVVPMRDRDQNMANLRSHLVMRVPKGKHAKIFGSNPNEIKPRHVREFA